MQKIYILKYFIYIFFLCHFSSVLAQDQQPINYKSDRTRIDEENYPGATIFTKVNNQVYFDHDGIEVWCDQALFYQADEFFKAYGNVKMVQGDTVTLTSKYAEYNGITQFAFASEDVVLTSPSNTLLTDTLFFNRQKQESYYRSGGIVKDSTNTIESIIGRYYMEKEKYAFRKNVVVTNPDYIIHTDILDFYTETGHAYLYGPSTITGEDSKIYCEKGFYDTQLDEGHFQENANVDYDTRNLKGDSIYFRQRDNFASATNNIVVTDTINNSVVKGHYAEMYKDLDSLFITKNPIASSLQDKDSVHIASDILMLTGKADQRIMRAFKDARIFKNDLSGKADSIWSSESIGLTKMITNPILWAEESQITGDTIHLISNIETNKLDTLKVFYDSFMVMKDTIEGFNQVKGKEMYALFNEDNEIHEVNFIKNTETIYYVREDDGDLIGIDKAMSSAIQLFLEDNEIVIIDYKTNVDSSLYPEEEFPPNFRRLKGFLWRGDETIRSKEDLFKGREEVELVPIQGIIDPDLMEEEDEGFFETKDGESLINARSSLEEEIDKKDGERNLIPKPKPEIKIESRTQLQKENNVKLENN